MSSLQRRFGLSTDLKICKMIWCDKLFVHDEFPEAELAGGCVSQMLTSRYVDVAAEAGGAWSADTQPVSVVPHGCLWLCQSASPFYPGPGKIPPFTFTFHLGFVHPLQDVALHQCLPLSSVCCFPVSPFTKALSIHCRM